MADSIPEKFRWVVQVPLSDADKTWFDVCECMTPEGLAAVVGALAKAGDGCPMLVRIDKRYNPY